MTSPNKPRREATDPMRRAFCRTIESLRRGEVSSYGEIAEKAGYPRRHRAVGQLLAVSFDALPWWRIVYASGSLPPVNPGLQEQRLIEEGVTLCRGRVIHAPLGMFSKSR